MEANQEIFLTVENKLMVTRGEMGGGMGFKGCTCDEHWMLYVSDESLNFLLLKPILHCILTKI